MKWALCGLLALSPAGQDMAVLEGTVIDASTGRPVAGAKVRAAVQGNETRPATATADSKGSFQLSLPPQGGTLSVLASAKNYAPGRLFGPQLKTGEVRSGLLLPLRRGLEAAGTVVSEESGRPVARATIVAHRSPGDADALRLEDEDAPRAATDREGRFRLGGLEPGKYRFAVSHPRYACPNALEVDVVAGRPNEIPKIVLRPSASVSGVVVDARGQAVVGAEVSGFGAEGARGTTHTGSEGRFTLAGFLTGASVTLSVRAPGLGPGEEVVKAPANRVVIVLSPRGLLRGRVEDAVTGIPLSDFRIGVSLEPQPGSGFPAGGIPGNRSFHSEDGSFEWKDLPPGKWTLWARSEGYEKAELPGVEIHPGEATEGISFALEKGAELVGRVVEAATGSPVAGATVTWRVAGEPEDSPTDPSRREDAPVTEADGRFELQGLPARTLTLTAHAPSYAATTRDVTAGQEGEVELSLKSGGALSGVVRAADGRTPASGAEVRIGVTGGNRFGADESTLAGAWGDFSFGGLPAGRYRLTAEASGGRAKPSEVVLRQGERRAGLVLVLAAGATVRGRVTGLAPGELGDLHVGAHSGGDSFEASAPVSSAGAFAIPGVPAGTVQVTASAPSGRSASRMVEIPEGVPEVAVDLEFFSGGRLSGRVTRAGEPVPSLSVSATPLSPDGTSAWARTDSQGGYALEGLGEGDYRVRAGFGREATVTVSGDTLLDIELPPGSLSGTVADAGSGGPLPGVDVDVAPLGQGGSPGGGRQTATDAFGRFSLLGLEGGPYRLSARKRGFKLHTETVSLSGADPGLAIVLERGEGTLIRVKDGTSGLPLRSVAIVALSGQGPLSLGEVELDDAGQGELSQLAAGRYRLLALSVGYAPRMVTGAVPGPPIPIVMTPGGRLEIHVDPGRVGAEASLREAGGAAPAWLLGEDRRFVLSRPLLALENVPPGDYELGVRLGQETKAYPAKVLEGRSTRLEVR